DVLRLLEVLHAAGVLLEFAVVELDSARVLAAAVDQVVFLGALGFESGARQRQVERHRQHGAEKEDDEEGVAPILPMSRCKPAVVPAFGALQAWAPQAGWKAGSQAGLLAPRQSHPLVSVNGTVCWAWNSRSSTTSEFTPMRMTLYFFLITSPSAAT